MKHKGFTVVELLVVIVVIIILATITIASYAYLRDDAMDTKIKTTVKSVGDAIQLHESRNNGRIAGTGAFNVANGVDTLVPQFLKQGYRDGLTSKNVASANAIFHWLPCNDGSGGFVIYASLNSPTAEDQALYDATRSSSRCNNSSLPAGLNYAQVF